LIKLGTDGSGVGVIIHGCPYCEDIETKNLRYYDSHWIIDPDMDAGRRSFWIHYCPCCGKLLPLLGGWEVKHPKESDK